MEYEQFVRQLKRHEGYRDRIYFDSAGIPTGGWGHAFLSGSRIPVAASLSLFHADLMSVERDYEKLRLPLDDPVREFVVKNMLFNLGLVRFAGFKRALAALRSGDFRRTSEEMLNSKWARQVKGRAVELADMMLTGEYKRK